MSKILSGTYSTLVTIGLTTLNPTNITGSAQLRAGLEVTVAGLTVTNAGSVTAPSPGNGILLDLGGNVSNAGGLISAYYGINDRDGALTVVNAGSIIGNNTAIYMLAGNITQSGSITNQSGATISGGIVGVAIAGATGTVTNAGTIKGFGSYGLNLYGGGSVTNVGSTSNIAGGISGGQSLTVVNSGSVIGASFGQGIVLNAGGSVTNQTGGSIRGGVNGIYDPATAVQPITVVNNGSIVGNTANKTGSGVFIATSGNITNQSKGLISGHNGIYMAGTDTVVNAGTITGVTGIAFAQGASQTVINAGSIIGTGGTAVAFAGTDNNLLVLQNGGTFKGVMVGASAAANTVQLIGITTAPTSATYSGTGLVNFPTVVFGPGATNDGTLVVPSDVRLPSSIVGFTSPYDAINLTGLSDAANNAAVTFDSTSDLLTVISGTNTVQLQLDNENYNGIFFNVQKIAGGSGTQVQALPPPIVSAVTTSPASGDLGYGKIITFTLNFTETVTVTGGAPTLLLNDGGTAKYSGGTGTNALTFTYAVGAGQDTPDLAVTGSNLNGAIIRHGSGDPADLTGADINPAGTLQIDTTNLLFVDDLKTKTANPATVGTAYTGPVAGILHQYVPATIDSLDVITSTPDWYIKTAAGNDIINVSEGGGNNILSDSTGFSFLIGGAGNDTFYTDDTTLTATTWSTIMGFHKGENATVWGLTLADFAMTHTDTMTGALGLTFDFAKDKSSIQAYVTLAGYSSADYLDGRLSVSFGTSTKTSTMAATPFMLIHAN